MPGSNIVAFPSTLSTPPSPPLTLSSASLDEDQQAAITRLVEHDHTLLIAGMGAGKTVICLTALDELLQLDAVRRVLVVAPLRVAEDVWAHECAKWDHLQRLEVAVCTGTPERRRAAIASDAPIVVVNVDNLAWLIRERLHESFDALVVDESTQLKSAGGKAFKALRRILKSFHWRVCMSGTPVAEGLLDLYAQMIIVDGGRSLGRSKQAYLDRYFYPTDWDRHNWAPRPGMPEQIARRIAHYVHTVPDYTHTLPPLRIVPERLPLPAEVMTIYRSLAKELVYGDVEAVNEATLQGKLHQLAAGFLYGPDDAVHHIHDVKMDACRAWMDADPGVIVYWWEWQRERLREMGVAIFADDPQRLGAQWSAGELRHLALHPRSAGHGLNLQTGGHRMLWLSPYWSLDRHDQTIARLWRRGQTHPVTVTLLLAKETVDEVVIARTASKREASEAFHAHIQSLT